MFHLEKIAKNISNRCFLKMDWEINTALMKLLFDHAKMCLELRF